MQRNVQKGSTEQELDHCFLSHKNTDRGGEQSSGFIHSHQTHKDLLSQVWKSRHLFSLILYKHCRNRCLMKKFMLEKNVIRVETLGSQLGSQKFCIPHPYGGIISVEECVSVCVCV